jgi:uncharacterized protein HemX
MPTKKKVAVASRPAKKSSHKKGLIAAGLVAGAALGVATAFYLNSPQGRKMLQKAEKKAMELQKKLMKELSKTQKLTKEKYAEIVEKLVAYYTKTKDITASEVPEIKGYLMDKWKTIEKEYRSVK